MIFFMNMSKLHIFEKAKHLASGASKKLLSLCTRMKPDPNHSPRGKLSFSCIKDLNTRPDTMELLKDKVENKVQDLGIGKHFVKTPLSQGIMPTVDKGNFMKL